MKALVARLTGKNREGDPINIHVTVFWATVVFWTIACGCFIIVQTVD
jgi:hypothetical protein